MNLTIKINMDNAAFEEAEPAYEVSRILRVYSANIRNGYDMNYKLYDINGNHVGDADLTDD